MDVAPNLPDFEDYLNDVFMAEIGFQMLDDALADGFEAWLEQQQVDDIIKWANEYAAKFRKETLGKETQGFVPYSGAVGGFYG